ncbi:MAG: response regulator transcription factor, partial [Campylobacteraceae bacterium]|nr:response regulator transcription factor [Campylobacteraceae bacterium]
MKLEDLSVLYAEDEIKIQETITEVLELYVDNVICAKDGEEALNLYNTYKPNILLLDICMPKIDGLKVLKKIREKDLLTPVIIMTAHTEQEYLLDAVELYITKYLIKPFNKNDLINALDECLNVLYKKQENKIKLNKKIEFNLLDNTIIKDEEKIQLNKKESLLLNLLIKSTPNIVSYEEIEYHLWQDTYVSKEAFKS